MIILGIQKDHNASVALFNDTNLIYYNQEERLNKIKKFSGFPFLCLDQVKKIINKVDKVVFTGYDTDNSLETVYGYLKYRIKLIDDIKSQTFNFHKSHHLIHAAKAYFNSGFDKAIVVIVDGRGSSYNLTNGYLGYETTSVFHVENNNFKCIYKKLFTNSDIKEHIQVNYKQEHNIFFDINPISLDKNTIFKISNVDDIGNAYAKVSNLYGFENEEGKLMGLSAYGKTDIYPKKFVNLCYEAQNKFEQDYLKLINKQNFNFSSNLILSGGTALNVVNNYKLKKQFPKINFYIEPLCGDEGNSIGACQLYFNKAFPEKKLKKIDNLFIGNKYKYDFKLNEGEINYKNIDIEDIVNILLNKNIVALYQNRSEAGPRALGNRSLLLDPRIKNGKDIMNTIKRREPFRPFACSILKEKMHEWFDMAELDESPFMMYAVNALKGVQEKINSVIHIDNTCRVQTISKEYNEVLHDILKEFDKKTNVPILMNTSFNLAGEPLVETPEDAINILRKSKIEYLYFSEIKELIYIKNNFLLLNI